MPNRCVGFVVVGEVITLVDAEIPDDPGAPITIVADNTWRLPSGARPSAYNVLHQICADYVRENGIASVVVKASALPTGPTKLGHLTSAEVRGVIVAAAASVCNVKTLSKAVISRTYGDRKVDEYIQDDTFWNDNTIGGKLRKTSREAAMLVIAARGA
jgi:hypothetical protein